MEELNNIKPYEISIWEDIPTVDENGNSYFKEEKVAIIGSDQLTAQHRCINPIFTENINGSETLTFTMYTNYFDEAQNKWVQNPFSKMLVNERKIKLKYEDKWHDFIIKNVQESSENNTYQYTCDSLPIAELSKNGFSIEFNNELMNNTKTINEFVREVLEGTDWTLPAENEITLQEAQEEPVVELKLNSDISAVKMKKIEDRNQNESGEEFVTIKSGATIYAAYSSYNPDSDILYFLYVDGDVEKDESTRVITNAECYYLLNPEWSGDSLSSAISNGVSTEYRGKFFKRTIVSEYNDILGRYVNVYESNLGNKVYGYTETEIIEPSVTQNLMTSDNDFLYSVEKDYTGWREFKGSGNETILAFSHPFPIYDKKTKEFSFGVDEDNNVIIPTTYLCLGFSGGNTYKNKNNLVLNTGILDNLQDIIGGFPKDKEYVFRIKYKKCSTNPETVTGPKDGNFSFENIGENKLNLILAKYSTNENGELNDITDDDIYLEIIPSTKEIKINEETQEKEETGYYYGTGKIKKTITGSDLKLTTQTQGYGLFLYSNYSGSEPIYYAIEEAQFFEYLKDLNKNMVVPGDLDISSNAYTKTTEKYFYPVNEINNVNSVLTEDDIEFMSKLPNTDDETYSLKYDTTYEKKRTITASESNRFNILQSLCETFECWIKFNIEHENNGEIKTKEVTEDNGTKHIRQIKTVSFIDYSSNNIKYPGFTYGINLSSIQRTLNSDKIVSKIIVKDNSNSLAQNGFCTIARAKDNPTGENFFYDFNYYIGQKLISHDEVINDLYGIPIIYGESNNITPMYDYHSIPPYSEYMEYGTKRRGYFYSNTVFNPNFKNGAQNGKNALGKDYDGEDARLFGPYCYYTNKHKNQGYTNYEVFYSPVYSFNTPITNITASFYYKIGVDSSTKAKIKITYYFGAGGNFDSKPMEITLDKKRSDESNANVNESGAWTLYSFNVSSSTPKTIFYYTIQNMGPSDTNGTISDSKDPRTAIRFNNLNIWTSEDSGLCYYKKYKDYNNFNQKLIEKQVETSTAITKVEAEVTYYKEAIDAAVIESENITEELSVLNNNYEIAKEEYQRATKFFQSLIGEIKTEVADPLFGLFSSVENTFNNFSQKKEEVDSTIEKNEKENTSTNGVEGTSSIMDEINTQIAEALVRQNQITFNISALTEYFLYYSEKLLELKIFYNDISDVINYYYDKKQILNNIFYDKYCRYIQEGSWTSNDYIDDDLYYYDAQNVLSSSVSPQVSYSISVIDISQLDGYELFNYKIGDHTFVEDTEFFGWLAKQGTDGTFTYTPYKEEVIVSEFSHSLDSPESNKITVQNYKTQFEDLFQRITATTQSLQYASGAYNRAANSVNPDGTFDADLLQNTLLGSAIQIINPDNTSLVWDSDGLKVIDKVNHNNIIKLSSGQISISDDGGSTWTAAITAKGINIGMVTSGVINTDKIYIGNSNDYAFRWDKTGLNAYSKADVVTNEIKDEEGNVISSTIVPTYNYGKFVRFDSYGIYGYENGTTFIPAKLSDIKEKASFGLTWDGFFLKSKHKKNNEIDANDKGYIEIDSQEDFRVMGVGDNSTVIERIKIGLLDNNNYTYGIRIKNRKGNTVMETDSNGNLILTGTITADAGRIGGWNIYENKLTSVLGDSNGKTTSGIVLNAGTSSMYSASYLDSTGRTGWAITENDAYFNNITLRGSLKCAVLEYAEVQAVGGVLMVRPATSIKRRSEEIQDAKVETRLSSGLINIGNIGNSGLEYHFTTIKLEVENNNVFKSFDDSFFPQYTHYGDWCKLTTEIDLDEPIETISYGGINTNLFRCVYKRDFEESVIDENGNELIDSDGNPVTRTAHYIYLDVTELNNENSEAISDLLSINFNGLGVVNFGATSQEIQEQKKWDIQSDSNIGIGLNSSANDVMLPPTSLSVFSLEESEYSGTSGWKYLKPHIILGKIPDNSDLYGSIAGQYGLYADAAKITGEIHATSLFLGKDQDSDLVKDLDTIIGDKIKNAIGALDKGYILEFDKDGELIRGHSPKISYEYLDGNGITVDDSTSAVNIKVTFDDDDKKSYIVSKEGLMISNNAIIKGGIIASTGIIGGWSIYDNKISYNSNQYFMSPTGIETVLSSGPQGSKAVMAIFNANDKFIVDTYGDLYAFNAYVKGEVHADSGTIGGWTITSTKIYGGGDDSTYEKVAVMQLPRNDITWVFAAGGNSHSSYADCPFRVDKDGNLYASSANITGEINATSGTIGGWVISKLASGNRFIASNSTNNPNIMLFSSPSAGTVISSNTSSNGYYVYNENFSHRNNWLILAGVMSSNSLGYKFGIDNNGKLYAYDANIRGQIEAVSGSLGKWIIDSYRLYCDFKDSNNTYNRLFIQVNGPDAEEGQAYDASKVAQISGQYRVEEEGKFKYRWYIFADGSVWFDNLKLGPDPLPYVNISSQRALFFCDEGVEISGALNVSGGIMTDTGIGCPNFSTDNSETLMTGIIKYFSDNPLSSKNIKITDPYHKIIIGQDKGMRIGIYSTNDKNSIRIRTPREDNASDDWSIWADYNNNTTWGVRYNGEARFTRVLFGTNPLKSAVAYTADNDDGDCFIVPNSGAAIRLYSGNISSPTTGNFSIRTSGSSQGGYLQGTWKLDGSPIAASSDKNYKNSIKNISNKYEILFNNLKPSLYKYNNGTSNRYHTGFIAQDVENAIALAGLTTQDFGGLVIDKQINEDTNQEEAQYYLRYEEFIALNTLEIQKLKEKIKILENKISEMQ